MYDHNTIHKWVCTNFPQSKQKIASLKVKNVSKDVTSRGYLAGEENGSTFERILEKLSINFCAELCHVLAIVKLKEHNSSIGFNRIRLMLDQSQDKRGKC